MIQCDFRELTKYFHEPFDAIINVGNSLPYLKTDEDILHALSENYELLKENGILVLNIRNYDKLVRDHPRALLISRRINQVFVYVFEYPPEKIVFNVIHLQFFPPHFDVHSTEYYPLYYNKLVDLIQRAGFRVVQCYQDFNETPFDIDSSDQISIVCKKQID